MIEPTNTGLQLGAGYAPTPGWDRIDLNPNVPDLLWQGDAGGPLPFPDASYERLRAVDILEHLPYRRTLEVLREWRRVTKPGGQLYVQVPDCGRIMAEYVEKPSRWRERLPADLQALPPILGVAWRILGGQDDGTYVHEGDDPRLNLHMAMFDRPSLLWYLNESGWAPRVIESNIHPNLCCNAVAV